MLQSQINFGEWIVPLNPSYDEETVMSCPLDGNPSTSYKWYFEKLQNYTRSHSYRVPIHPDSYLNITFLNNNRTLYFSNVKEEHNGYYTCNAENHLGNKTYDKFKLFNIQSKMIGNI